MAVKRKTTRRKATPKTAAKRSTPARRKPAARKTTSRRTAATRRKPAARKAPARKRPAATKKKAAAKPKLVKTPIRKRLTKGQIVGTIAESAGLSRSQVSMVMDGLEGIIARSVKRGSTGEFLLPGLLKIVSVKVPARKARPGVNPFTGEKIMIKARPASNSVRVRPLKKLKGFAAS